MKQSLRLVGAGVVVLVVLSACGGGDELAEQTVAPGTVTTAPTQTAGEVPTKAPTEVPTEAPTEAPAEAPTEAPPTPGPADERAPVDEGSSTAHDPAIQGYVRDLCLAGRNYEAAFAQAIAGLGPGADPDLRDPQVFAVVLGDAFMALHAILPNPGQPYFDAHYPQIVNQALSARAFLEIPISQIESIRRALDAGQEPDPGSLFLLRDLLSDSAGDMTYEDGTRLFEAAEGVEECEGSRFLSAFIFGTVGRFAVAPHDEASAPVTPAATDTPPSPTFATPAGAYTDITVGAYHACALTQAGAAVCWDIQSGIVWDTPPGHYAFIASQGGDTCAITVGGDIACWEAGGGPLPEDVYDPSRDAPPGEYTALSWDGPVRGEGHSCGLTRAGEVVCWGDPGLPDGAREPPSGSYNGLSVRFGRNDSGSNSVSVCALAVSGDMECWGTTWHPDRPGEYDGHRSSRGGNYATVSGGCLLTPRGKVERCRLSNTGYESRYTALSADPHHICAVSIYGQATCSARHRLPFGAPRVMRPPDPSPNHFVAISTGATSYDARTGEADVHACALTETGAAVCWGSIVNKVKRPQPAPERYIGVSDARGHTCALAEEGSVTCWGWNDFGQIEVRPGRYTAISTADTFTCALTEAGGLTCWGWPHTTDGYGWLEWPGPFKAVSTSGFDVCVLTQEDEVVCLTVRPSRYFESPELPGPFKSISAGGSGSACAVTMSGEGICWNASGETRELPGRYGSISAPSKCAITEVGAVECWTGALPWLPEGLPEDRIVEVSRRAEHACVLTQAGEASCWGSFEARTARGSVEYGPVDPPAGRYTAISSGLRRACGLTQSGDVVCWGDTDYEERPTIPATPTEAPPALAPRPESTSASTLTASLEARPPDPPGRVSAGGAHTCALQESGEVVCWGNNDHGQLDAPPGRFRSVSAGPTHTCGLRESREVVCWGGNENGQAEAPSGRFRTVSAGWDRTCALQESREVLCWGNSEFVQSRVPAGPFLSVTTGWSYACALRPSGEVVCWGSGDGVRAEMPSGSFYSVSAGTDHLCGLRRSGEVVCWSTNSWGQLRGVPTGSFRSVSAGATHTCAIRESGEVACWGWDELPQAEPPSGKYRSVSVGFDHACAERESGEVDCWGSNEHGQTEDPPGPYRLVSAGWMHTCALRESGEIDCWGFNDNDRFPPPAGSYISVSAGDVHTCAVNESGEVACWSHGQDRSPTDGGYRLVSTAGLERCALKESGEVACWGGNYSRYYDPPPGPFSLIDTGGGICGLRETGEVQCWGLGVYWQMDTPPGTYRSITAGEEHACALDMGGEIVCWDGAGQLETPSGSFQSVSAGSQHACAIRLSGELVCWGNNDHGQLNAPEGVYRSLDSGRYHTCAVNPEGVVVCWGLSHHGQGDVAGRTTVPEGATLR